MSHTETVETPQSFSNDARRVVRAVRTALSEILVSVGADTLSPQSVARRLKLSSNLAWKLTKILEVEDPSVVFEHMPGASGKRILIEKCRAANVSSDLIEHLGTAFADYQRLIEVHTGDRATLEIMGGELSSSRRRQRDEHHRKQLFQGASYVWGAQCRVLLKMGLTVPGREEGLLDFASVSAFVDFRRLRPDIRWVMARRFSSNDDGTQMDRAPAEPIDPRSAGPERAPLLLDFCSEPLDLFRVDDGDAIAFELREGPVGNTGALTCISGAIQRDIPYYRTASNDWGNHIARCEIPAQLMLMDMYFHRSFDFAMSPEVQLLSELPEQRAAGQQELPISESLQDLGRSAVPASTPDVPFYRELMDYLHARLGCDPGDMHGFRLGLPYPPYRTSLMLRFPLPERPA